MSARMDWRRRILVIFYGLVLLLYPITAITIYLAQLNTPMPELHVLAINPAIIYRVYPGSGAEAAGVRAGDVIRGMNGLPFQPEHLSYQLRDMRVGQLLSLELERSGERFEVKVPLISVRDVVAKRFLLFSTIGLIIWIVSALLVWQRFQRIELRLLFLLCQAMSLGLLFPYVDVITWFSTTTWAVGLSALGGILSALLVFHFNISYPVPLGTVKQRRYLLSTIYTVGLVLFVGWAIHNYSKFQWHSLGVWTTEYPALVVTAAIFIQLYIYVRRASPDQRRRLRMIMLGELLAGGPPALLYLVPAAVLGYAFIPEWLLMVFVSIAPAAYSIATLRDNLFDIDRILNHSVVITLFLLVIVVFLLAPTSIIFWIMGSWPGSIFLVAALLLVVFMMFERARSFIQHLVDRLFYGGWYDYPRVVERASDALAGSLEWEQLVDILTRRIPRLMQLHGAYLQIEEQSTPKLDASLQPQMQFPLMFENKICGQWVVGPRRDGEIFSSDDTRILNTLARQAAIAVSNMLLVKGMHAQLEEIRANRELLAHIDRQLLTTREEERSRLARDLHDGPVQSLIALNFQLGLVQANGDVNAVENIREEIKNVIFELRSLCAELRPPMLDTIGLGAALRDLVHDWSVQNTIPVSISQPEDAFLRALPEEVKVNLYRVAQEAFSNIARHALASHVNLCLVWDEAESRLSMMIEDDGRGFEYDPAELTAADDHLGLINMRERVGLFGGEWRLDTAPGQGTRILTTWRVPHTAQIASI